MQNKVFISYSSQDRGLAERAKLELEAKGHLPSGTMFLDPQDMLASEQIRQKVKSDIEASDLVVIVMSEHAATSQWVNYEAGLADALGKKILVVGQKGTGKTALLANLAAYQHVELDDAS